MAFSPQNFAGLLKVAVQHKASDVHIRSNESPGLRINGELVPVQSKPFSATDIIDIIKMLDPSIEDPTSINERDGGLEIKNLCRLRYNIFRYNNQFGIVLRIVKLDVPTIDELNLPYAIKDISNNRRGLVLVTGATGSGKSTTLAAMIDEINATRPCHIVTLEDPIEYVHQSNKARVSQREIGKDTENFSTGLRGALRQDPDIILIGEMRDPETISIALKAAETGHLVLSTVHTTNALSTIGRIISMFPAEEQGEIRKRLAENLKATISQRMLKANTESKVAIAQEIMISTPGIRECIRGEEPLGRIVNIIKEGKGRSGNGSQSFDQHIMDLYNDRIVTKEQALASVESESDFLQQLDFE
jgi:twitching motility protein PilT